MKNLFQNLDLYKVIILASLVLLPAVGFWAYRLNGEIELGRVAIRNALKEKGDLEEIGKYEKAVEEQKRNSDKEEGQESYSVYFQKHIVHGAGRLRRVNFEIGAPQENQVKGKAIDTVVPIKFQDENKALALTRDEILAIVFNCESQSPAWKLQELSIRNESVGAQGKAPPPELEDKWIVGSMKFVSRRPLRAANK